MENMTSDRDDNSTDVSPTAFRLPYAGTNFLWMTIAYAVLTGFGLVTNSLVIYIVCRYNEMHTPTNFFFCNLALTDFFFLLFFGVPYTLTSMGLTFNNIVFCRFVHYMRAVSISFLSVFSLIMLILLSYYSIGYTATLLFEPRSTSTSEGTTSPLKNPRATHDEVPMVYLQLLMCRESNFRVQLKVALVTHLAGLPCDVHPVTEYLRLWELERSTTTAE